MITFEIMVESQAAMDEPGESGDLITAPFVRVFYRICRERLTVRLDVRDKSPDDGGKILKRILVMDGSLFAVQGGSVKETLGQILVAQGKLSEEQYEALKKECEDDHGRMEQKILSSAVIPPAELSELLSLQAALKIKTLFALIQGHYECRPVLRESLVSGHVMVPLSPEKLLLEGTLEYYPPPRIKKEFPGLDKKVFSLGPEFKEQIGRFGLSPAMLRWLRTVPASFNFPSLLRSAPKGEDRAPNVLLAFYFAGLITLPEGEDDFPLGRAYQETKKAPKVEEKKDKKSAVPEPAQPAPTAEVKKDEPRLPIEEMLDREMSDPELLAELDKLLVVVANPESNYFDVLGVKQDTPPAKIKQVYFKIARRFHPDARPDLYVDKIKDKVEDLFTKVSEAYNVVGDNEARTEYTKTLRSTVSKEDMDKASRAIEAEMEFQKAEILLKKGAWKEAAELLDRSVKLVPDEPEYKLHLAWAQYRLKGPSESAASRRIIKQALDARPKAANGYFYLGSIAKNDGNLDEAEEYLSKASQMSPHDVEIKRELQLLRRRQVKGAAEPKKGGFFGKKK